MGDPDNPWDATRNGPFCPAPGSTSEDADRIRNTNITDVIANLAEGALVGAVWVGEGFCSLQSCASKPLTSKLSSTYRVEVFF